MKTDTAIRNLEFALNGHQLWMNDDLANENPIPTTRLVRDKTGNVVPQTENLLKQSRGERGDHIFLFPSRGLVPDIFNIATASNRRLAIERNELSELPPPVIGHDPIPGMENLFKTIRLAPCGQIEILPDVSIPRVVAEIADAFPSGRIAVIVKSTNYAKVFLARLSLDVADTGLVTTRDHRQAQTRIVVGTPKSMECQHWFRERHLVLLLDAARVVNRHESLALIEMNAKFRLFGFHVAGERLSPWVRDRMRAAYGPSSRSYR